MIFDILKRLYYRTFLWLTGWKTVATLSPEVKRYIILLVPHTSNWDFPYGVASRPFIGIDNCKFLIKKDWLDVPVIGKYIAWLGGVPVDRAKNTNLVDQVVEEFEKREELGVAITPEGTRKLTDGWKTGFYRIAEKANVPVACGFIDYHRREIGVDKVLYPSGDMEKDLKELEDFYRHKIPMYTEKSSLNHIIPTKKRSIAWHLVPVWRIGLFVLIIFALVNYEMVWYGIKQGYGQMNIILNAQPIGDFLNDPEYPQEKKEKIRLVQDLRAFAFDSLGLDRNESYTSLYDQQDEPILWNVTACEPYQLQAYTWEFPILGTFSYKGFFSLEGAKEAANELKEQGYDIDIREVGGWSTLGILNDPILSEMLERSTGSLANLIIHELTHGTLYVKDGVSYNENLASFVGDYGALRFLRSTYGVESEEYLQYTNGKVDRDLFTNYTLTAAKSLDSLYKAMGEGLDITQKEAQKKSFLEGFVEGLQEVPFSNKRYYDIFSEELPNNTFFMSRLRYKGQQNQFKEEFEQQFKGDFPKYLAHLKETYPSLF